MHPDVAEIVERFDLGPDVALALDKLFARAGAGNSVTTLVVGFDPVDIENTYWEGRSDQGHRAEPDRGGEAPRIGNELGSTRIGERYVDLAPIGEGGMGEVRRVLDVELNRTLAMKTLHAPLSAGSARRRFLEEAQATAQLQHPNIVPVHDIGSLPDGRIWFTMKEVRGRTLGAVNADVHQASDYRWNPTADGWSFKRVLTSFLAVCNAMAYAHERGVVHRDLKPENVMVGGHGLRLLPASRCRGRRLARGLAGAAGRLARCSRLPRVAGRAHRQALASARRARVGESRTRRRWPLVPVGKRAGPFLVLHDRQPRQDPSAGGCGQLPGRCQSIRGARHGRKRRGLVLGLVRH